MPHESKRRRMRDRLAWATGLRGAVERLHARNLIHGDICANNVMINHDGRIKLLDFGLGQKTSGRKINIQLDLQQLDTLCNSMLHKK